MFRSPLSFPSMTDMLHDVKYATPRQIARHLGIAESTLLTYRRVDHAPRAIQVALYWETHWGRACADIEASNFAALQVSFRNSAIDQADRLRKHVARLECELALEPGKRAANLPVWRAA